MKKIIFMLFGLLAINSGFGQCACCSSSSNFSAGELSPTAYALGKKQLMGEMYSDYRFFNGTSHTNHSDHQSQNVAPVIHSMVIGILGLRYGINSKVNLLVQQPYILINGTATNSKAFGDLLSMVNYKAYDKANFVIGLQMGIEWPTGQYMQTGGGNSISTGSGSYDPVAGLNAIKAFSRSTLRGSAFFKYTTMGYNSTNYGDFFGHQLSYNYFLLSPVNSCSSDSTKKNPLQLSWSILAQVSGEWSQAQSINHTLIENTGSYVALVSLGTSFGLKGFSIPLMISTPVYQDYHGSQNQTKFRFRIGLTKTFN